MIAHQLFPGGREIVTLYMLKFNSHPQLVLSFVFLTHNRNDGLKCSLKILKNAGIRRMWTSLSMSSTITVLH
jgi:hypothetical protein